MDITAGVQTYEVRSMSGKDITYIGVSADLLHGCGRVLMKWTRLFPVQLR
jgi:hypothetical protein